MNMKDYMKDYLIYCEDILNEAKDYRQIMKEKIGLTEEVAEYLHNFSNKYSLWFANEIKKMADFKNSKSPVLWIQNNIAHKMTGILDWVTNVQNTNLKAYNWEKAVQASEEYHDNLENISLEGIEENTILKKYNDGYYWVDLETNHSQEEGIAMGHCGGSQKCDTIYSLRFYDKHTQSIDPKITLAISPKKHTWYQCKGKKNSLPKEEYHPYIADILFNKDIYIYKSDYKPEHDFKSDDLINYINENPDDFPDHEGFLSNIKGNKITLKDFEQILEDHGPKKYYDMCIIDDEDFCSVMISLDLEIKETDDEDIYDILSKYNSYSGDEKRDIRKCLSKALSQISIEEVEIDLPEDNVVRIMMRIEDSDTEYLTMDDDGLEMFETVCKYYEQEDQRLELSEFLSSLKKQFIENNFLFNEFTEFIEEIKDLKLSNVKYIQLEDVTNISIHYKPFSTLLENYPQYNNSLNQYYQCDYVQSFGKMTKDQQQKYNYMSYMIEFFYNLITNQLNIKENVYITVRSASNLVNADPNDKSHNFIIKYYIEDKISEDDLSNIKKINTEYDNIVKQYEQFFEDILFYVYETRIPYTVNDIYYDEKDLPDKNNAYDFKNVPYYDKESHLKLDTILVFGNDNVLDKIEERLKAYPRLKSGEEYDPELVKDYMQNR